MQFPFLKTLLTRRELQHLSGTYNTGDQIQDLMFKSPTLQLLYQFLDYMDVLSCQSWLQEGIAPPKSFSYRSFQQTYPPMGEGYSLWGFSSVLQRQNPILRLTRTRQPKLHKRTSQGEDTKFIFFLSRLAFHWIWLRSLVKMRCHISDTWWVGSHKVRTATF